MSMSHRSRAGIVAGLAATVLVLSACGSSTDSAGTSGGSAPASSAQASSSAPDSSAAGSASSAPAGEAGVVEIVITEADGCVATPDTIAAGAITFHVVNQDATGVTEVELVSDQRIRRRAGEPRARLRQHLLRPARRRDLRDLLPGRNDPAHPVHRHRRGRGSSPPT